MPHSLHSGRVRSTRPSSTISWRKERFSMEYTTPSLTHIGSFKALTKSLGDLPCDDVFNIPALWTTSPAC